MQWLFFVVFHRFIGVFEILIACYASEWHKLINLLFEFIAVMFCRRFVIQGLFVYVTLKNVK
jgi:hypothetical protein